VDGDVGIAGFAISPDGSLMYVAGPASGSLVWVDRAGMTTAALTDSFELRNPRLSPDGTRVAAGGMVAGDLWVFDLALGSRLRLTSEGANRTTAWSPDGQRIAFFSFPAMPTQPTDAQDLYVVSSGGGVPTRLLERAGPRWADSWSPDGRYLIFDDGPGYSRDLWVLPLGEEPRPLVVSRFNERVGTFAPDGRSFVFVSDESGRDEIYVQAFPGEGPKVPISVNGGREPVWARDGRELYYREGDTLMVVPVQHNPFRASPPRKLLDFPNALYGSNPYSAEYDVAADGRFLAVRRDPANEIQVILNWTEELRRALR
jgi:eukaryotic-like serine/threonine-protein kinase